MATMEEVVRRIVREEVAAAVADLRFTVTILGEEVELTARVGNAGAAVASQDQSGPVRIKQASTAGAPTVVAAREVPSPITDEFLAEVAGIYRQAVIDGERPNKTLQETFDRSRSAVSQWLRQAREKGLLPETEPGRVSTFDEGADGAGKE